jgi:hypothetical protein
MKARRSVAAEDLGGADWIRPYWLEKSSPPTWTTIGTVASMGKGVVDPRGLLTPWPDGWSLDWWIGAEDRWHFPSREAAVRQALVDETPVVETAIRVPGGDVVERIYGVPGPEPLAIVEITNRTPTPVAIALAVRPYNVAGMAVVRAIELVDRTVIVDGRPALQFAKRPQRAAGATFRDGDVATVVAGGGAANEFKTCRCPAGCAQGAFLFPLAHTATMRVVVTLGRPPFTWFGPSRATRAPEDASAFPGSDAVVKGWKAQTDRGTRLELPPGRIASAVEANRRALLLLHEGRTVVPRSLPDGAYVLSALRRFGFGREAAEVVDGLSARQRRRWADPSWYEDAFWSGTGKLDRVAALLDAASTTYTWAADAGGRFGPAATEFLLLVRDLLVREVSDGLVLLSAIPPSWAGQPIDVHDAPTRYGRLSYAIRWHGDRPAVLWDLNPDGRDAATTPVRLTIPGLDPSWATTEPRGDALLSAARDASESFT